MDCLEHYKSSIPCHSFQLERVTWWILASDSPTLGAIEEDWYVPTTLSEGVDYDIAQSLFASSTLNELTSTNTIKRFNTGKPTGNFSSSRGIYFSMTRGKATVFAL